MPSDSINDANGVAAILISVTAAIQDDKYHVSLNKPVLRLHGFMKAQKVDYVKDSYSEGINFTIDEATDISLTHRLWFLKLQVATQHQIQQS